jgi:hypothetical protein
MISDGDLPFLDFLEFGFGFDAAWKITSIYPPTA